MNNKENKDVLMIFTFFTLALSLVSTFSYMIYTIVSNGSLLNHIIGILGVIVLVVFSIILVITGFFIENKKAKIFIIIASLLLTLYSVIQIIIGVTTPKELLPNFVNKDIKEVITYFKNRNIDVIREYEFSDDIEQYHIISQSIKEGTEIRKIKDIKLVISNGIDKTKITKVDNLIGWNLDDVIEYIDENKLTNVTINFVFSNNVEKDKIMSQDVIQEITRNEPITLTCSLGRESNQKSVVMEDLVGMDLFHATIYLKRNNIKYSIIYSSDSDKEDIVLNQSIKKYEVINANRTQEMVLTISKLDETTVPDLSKMSKEAIDSWADKNRITIEYSEEYDDSIKEGKVISFNAKIGNNIKTGSTIKVVLSLGQLNMIKYTSVSSFEDWAKENKVSYDISYEFSDTVQQGKLISSTHKEGALIKNNDTVKIVVSEGGYTTVPNFIDLTLDQAKEKCVDNKISCSFSYQDNNISYTIISTQSMKANSKVPVNTSINLTIGK